MGQPAALQKVGLAVFKQPLHASSGPHKCLDLLQAATQHVLAMMLGNLSQLSVGGLGEACRVSTVAQ